jgi:hypothetical protein
MSKRNYLIIFLLSTGLLTNCASPENETTVNSNAAVLTAQVGGATYSGPDNVVHISTTITNLSLDTIRFRSMSCSYEDFFIVGENAGYSVLSRYDCYSNGPVTIVLPPNTQTKRFIMISTTNKPKKDHDRKLRIGMQYISPEESEGKSSFYANRFQLGTTLWSNEIDLSELDRDVVEILAH